MNSIAGSHIRQPFPPNIGAAPPPLPPFPPFVQRNPWRAALHDKKCCRFSTIFSHLKARSDFAAFFFMFSAEGELRMWGRPRSRELRSQLCEQSASSRGRLALSYPAPSPPAFSRFLYHD